MSVTEGGVDPYRVWPAYVNADIPFDVFPLPLGKKNPPPSGTTGRGAVPWSVEQLRAHQAPGNIGAHLRPGIVGVDIDQYVKGDITKSGWDSYEAFREAISLPPLPLDGTLWSSSRPIETRSGIYFFRVPVDWQPAGSHPWPSAEWVWWGHRYAVIWPSVHPEGGRYEWRWGDKPLPKIPRLLDVQWMPPEWLAALGADESEMTRRATREAREGGSSDVFSAWAASAGGMDEAPCSHLRQRAGRLLSDIRWGAEGSRHDAAVAGTAELAHLAAEGHRGAPAAVWDALSTLREVTGRGPDEVTRIVDGSVFRPLTGRPDDPCEKGGDPFSGIAPKSEWLEKRATPTGAPAEEDEAGAHSGGISMGLKNASTMRKTAVHWLYSGHLPIGQLVALAGREGIGKTALWCDIASRVSRGTLPGESEGIPRNVLVLNAEDDWSTTLAPRLAASGADMDRIFIPVTLPRRTPQGVIEVPVSALDLHADLETIRQTIIDNDIALVILDPITGRMGEVDAHRESEVRAVLEPVAAMAQEVGTTILGLIHLNKSGGNGDILNAVMGSKAFVSVPRLVMVASADPEMPGRMVWGVAKSNLGSRSLPGHRSEVVGVTMPSDDLDDPVDISVGVIRHMGDLPSSVVSYLEGAQTAARAPKTTPGSGRGEMTPQGPSQSATTVAGALLWLDRHLWHHVASPRTVVLEAAQGEGWSRRAIERAASRALGEGVMGVSRRGLIPGSPTGVLWHTMRAPWSPEPPGYESHDDEPDE